MKIKQSHRTTLKRITEPRLEKQLTEGDQSQLALHTVNYLHQCQALGLCVKIGDTWSLTNAGREAIKVEKSAKVDRICAFSVTEKYTGEDLRQLANRRGAYDFLNCPSLIGGKRFYRKDAV